MQLVNGVVLLITFFLSRLVWGPWHSFRVSRDVIRAYFHVHADTFDARDLVALGANSTLTQMITAIRRRFTGDMTGKRKEEGEMDARERVTVEYVNGAQVIGVEKTQVRKRKA